MLFDVKNFLSLPEIHNIVSKRDEVVNRFGPLSAILQSSHSGITLIF